MSIETAAPPKSLARRSYKNVLEQVIATGSEWFRTLAETEVGDAHA